MLHSEHGFVWCWNGHCGG